MPEGLRIVVDADTQAAEQALKSFANTAKDAGDQVGGSLAGAFDDLKRQGLISLGSVQDALKQLRAAVSTATDTSDIKKFNQAISFLAEKEKELKGLGIEEAFGGVSRGSLRAASATQNLAKVIQLFPPEISHVTHSFDQLILAYESMREGSATAGEALTKLGSAMIGPLGIATALSLVTTALSYFGVSLFDSKEETKKAEEATKEYEERQKAFKDSLDEAAKSVVSQASKFEDLKRVLVTTSNAYNVLTDSITKQGIAQFLFTQKEGLVNQLLSDQIKFGLKAAKAFSPGNAFQPDVPKNAKPLRIATEADFEKAGKGFSDIDKSIFDINELAKSLGINFSQFVDKADSLSKKDPFAKTIEEAKKLAEFLNKNTQFAVHFEVDPRDSEKETFDKAIEFKKKVKAFFESGSSEFGTFDFKPQVRLDLKFIPSENFFSNLRKAVEQQSPKTFEEAKNAFEKNINELAKNNPVLIEFETIQRAHAKAGERFDARNSFDQGLFGITAEPKDKDGKPLFSQAEENARRFAKTVNGILTPAFQDLFAAIKAGQDPLEAFFKGIGNAIQDLIQKLLSAALEALVLSAIFPGGIGGEKGFGSIFKGILGFAQGGIVTGPTLALIGEGAGTSHSNPEIVAPLDQLRSILGSSGGGGELAVVVTGRIRGQDLALQGSRTSRRQSRI